MTAPDLAAEDAFAGAIYGGAPGGLGSMDRATSDFIVALMDDMLDKQQSLPPLPA